MELWGVETGHENKRRGSAKSWLGKGCLALVKKGGLAAPVRPWALPLLHLFEQLPPGGYSGRTSTRTRMRSPGWYWVRVVYWRPAYS